MSRHTRVKPGQSFKPNPEAHNAFIAASQHVESLKALGGTQPERDNWQSTIIQVKNNSGFACNQFGVLGIDGVFPTPTDNLDAFKAGPILRGITPAYYPWSTSHWGRFVILLEPAESGAIVAGCISGFCVAKINITNVLHNFADVKDGDAAALASSFSGSAQIMKRESGLGLVWAVVRLGNVSNDFELHPHFELKTALTPGGTATAHLRRYDPDTDAYVTDTDEDLEFVVSDVEGLHRGRARDAFSSPHNEGSIGEARYFAESNRFEIERMQPHALWLVGDVYADFAEGVDFEIDGTEIAFPIGSIITNTDPAANIPVTNIHNWDGSEDGVAEVRWNEEQVRYETPELDCTT